MRDKLFDQYFPPEGRLCTNEEETRSAGKDLCGALGRGPALISLEGPLGAGKTCFVKGLAMAFGINPENVSSPTFSLVHEYTKGNRALAHLDLYLLDSPGELEALGLEDILAEHDITAIEWGDKFLSSLPPATIRLVFSLEDDARRIRLLR